jgi:serine/threonine protein phosphatase PrpC
MRGEDKNEATFLTNLAIEKNSKDNITVMIIDF